ncbi:hypothetical protein B0H19DRAFT_1055226 [Mycena capillaripes]|nr:hypothetical protein B0H19DRAFT_1055226 [Mycena capillaripes]
MISNSDRLLSGQHGVAHDVLGVAVLSDYYHSEFECNRNVGNQYRAPRFPPGRSSQGIMPSSAPDVVKAVSDCTVPPTGGIFPKISSSALVTGSPTATGLHRSPGHIFEKISRVQNSGIFSEDSPSTDRPLALSAIHSQAHAWEKSFVCSWNVMAKGSNDTPDATQQLRAMAKRVVLMRTRVETLATD